MEKSESRNLNTFLSDEPEEIEEYVEPRILTPESRLMIFGPAEVGKSVLVENLAFALAAGVPWVKFKIPKPRRVIYLQSEISDDYFWLRTTQMERHYGIRNKLAGERLFLHRDVDLRMDQSDGLERLCNWLDIVRPDVLIVDPFYMFSSRPDTDLVGNRRFVGIVNELMF